MGEEYVPRIWFNETVGGRPLKNSYTMSTGHVPAMFYVKRSRFVCSLYVTNQIFYKLNVELLTPFQGLYASIRHLAFVVQRLSWYHMEKQERKEDQRYWLCL